MFNAFKAIAVRSNAIPRRAVRFKVAFIALSIDQLIELMQLSG